MEFWFGPVIFGAAAFAFASWILSADSRRMGFFHPRDAKSDAKRGSAVENEGKTLMVLGLSAFLAACVPSARLLVAALALAAALKKILEKANRAKRIAEVRREWPFLIESMSVAALSGMETRIAFEAAAMRTRGVLREEVDKVMVRMMGGVPLSRALGAMDEWHLPEVKRLRSALAQSEILGTPIAGMLKRLSDESYEAERQQMEEKFNALPLKLTVVTVFCLLPPILAVSVFPHILTFLESGW